MITRVLAAALAALACAGQVFAQAAEPAPVEAVSAPGVRIPAGTLIDLETVQEVSSLTSKIGDRFPIRVVSPLMVDGVVVIPAGTMGVAEVTTATPAGMMAKGGELMVLARYLEIDGRQVPLRGLKLGVRGENNLFLAFVAAQAVGPLALFIKGGNVVFPAGTQAQAKIGAETVLVPAVAPPVPVTPPEPAPEPAAEPAPAPAS